MFNFLKKKDNKIMIDVFLKCPDGLYESAGFTLPKDLDSFIEYVNTFHDEKGYSIKLKKFNLEEAMAYLKGGKKYD